jgi:hypothetical protein
VITSWRNQEGASPPSAEDLARVKQRYELPDRFFLYLGGFDVRKNMQGVIGGYARYRAWRRCAVKLVLAGALPRQTPPFP